VTGEYAVACQHETVERTAPIAAGVGGRHRPKVLADADPRAIERTAMARGRSRGRAALLLLRSSATSGIHDPAPEPRTCFSMNPPLPPTRVVGFIGI
jgi:hypothetical protein